MIMDLLVEAVDYLRANRPDHGAAGGRRIAPHDHDDARAAAREPVLHRRRPDERLVSDQHDGLRRAHPEHARQQPRLLPRDGAPRDDSGAQPRRLPGLAVRRLPSQPQRRRAVFRRGLASLLGAHALRHGLQQDARTARRRALLADAPLRAHHLLAQVPYGPVVAAGGDRLPRRPRRPRARERDRGGPPLVRPGGRLRPALSGGLPAGRSAAARVAEGARRHEGS